MLKIRSFISEGVIDGKLHGVAEISVASSSELATTDGNHVFTDGSIAWAIEDGTFYGMSNGEWHEQGGASS